MKKSVFCVTFIAVLAFVAAVVGAGPAAGRSSQGERRTLQPERRLAR